MNESGYDGGGTKGGKFGCALAAILGGPLVAAPFLADALGDCVPGASCRTGPDWVFVAFAVLSACLIGFGSRWLINRVGRNRE